MAVLFLDGFDKYSGLNSNSAGVAALLTAGEWTSASSSFSIVAPLSATGFALNINGVSQVLARNVGNCSRLIGGFRFSNPLVGASGIQFVDTATNQAGIQFNTAGTFSVRNGAYLSGTILGTSTATVTANSVHYLEFDITFANAGSYQLWLDGVSILSGSGDTTGTANNYANIIQFASGSTTNLVIDDFYVFDSTGTTHNAPLLTSPRIETSFPGSDNSVQFGIGAATLGNNVQRTGTAYNPAANHFYLRPYTPSRNCTLNSIGVSGGTGTSGSIQLRPIVYADNGAGAPGTLLSAGSTVVGMTAGTTQTLPLTTPQSLSAGTQYWLGFMSDIAVSNVFTMQDASAQGRTATATFASGAPGTAPVTTTGQVTVTVWGNVSSTGANYYSVVGQPPQGNNSYLTDSTVGHEDLFTVGNLVSNPVTVHVVAIKAHCSRSDSGARTVSMRMKSSSVDSGGSLTGQTPGTSYGWLTSYFVTDPNTSAAWTPTNLNAALAGFKIDA